MAKRTKREERIRNNPTNAPLADFEWLIRHYGSIKEGSKHPQAIIGNRVVTYTRTNPVRPPYVEKVLEIIDKQK